MDPFRLECWFPLLQDLGARSSLHRGRRTPERKPDGSWVTAADREADEAWRGWAEQNGLLYLGEESASEFSPASDWTRDLLIVDPIDGTAPFTNGLPTWGISLGFARGARFRGGVLFLPEADTLLWSEAGVVYAYLGPWRALDVLQIRSMSTRLVAAPEVTEHGMVAVSQVLSKRGRFESPRYVLATASSVFSLAQLLLGRCAGYISSGCIWDFAGAFPLLKRLGFHGKFHHGNWLDLEDLASIFPLEDPFVARETIILGPTAEIVLEIERNSLVE